MKLRTISNVSLDGVTQGHRRIEVDGPGVYGEGGGFQRFGWGPPLLDDEASAFISDTFQRAEAFLFGRRTYELFAGYWGRRSGLAQRRKIRAAIPSQTP